MSDITVVEFETTQHGVIHLSELSDGPPYSVHGVALGAGDVTVGQSGIKKKWPADELQDAADSLQGTNLVEDHNNGASGVVGRVTKAGYKEGTGVVYEAELFDDDLAEKVKSGLLEVSIRGYHADVDALEEDEETGAKVVEDIEFDNLSIVPTGAAPSNTLQMGEHAELSAAQLAQFTGTLNKVAALAEIEPGMWVTDGDMHGITISQVEDGEVEVDIYEESDGKWRSIGSTEMMPTDSLDEWDVDEEEDIGSRQDEEKESEDEEENATLIEAGMQFYSTVNDTMITVVSVDGKQVELTGDDDPSGDTWIEPIKEVHEKIGSGEWDHAGHVDSSEESETEEMAGDFSNDDWVSWNWSDGTGYGKVVEVVEDGCRTVDGNERCAEEDDERVIVIEHTDTSGEEQDQQVVKYERNLSSWDGPSEEENASVGEGDFVQWSGPDADPMFGQVVGIEQDGEQFMAEIQLHTESGDRLDSTKRKPLQALDKWDGAPQSGDMETDSPDDMRDDSMRGIEAPTWEEGQMVKWQVNPAMRGKVVHVDREKKIIMVEVMEETEQGMQSTGFTVTAGYSDLTPMNEEMAGVSTRDVPTQDAQPEHETASVDTLLSRFIEETGDSEPSLSDFLDWMKSESLEIERGEGAEEILDSDSDLDASHEEQPHRYIDAEDEQSELEAKFDDYPEAAKENAQMALDAKDETDNPNDCGTDVGWKRAKQLANGEALTRDEVGKMSAFNRHRSNSEQSEEDGKADCGWMMWKAWGGDEGVDWAQRKLDSIEEENSMNDIDEEHMFSDRGDAEDKADDLGLDGVHEMDGMWVPGETHEEYMDAVSSNSKHMDEDSDEDEEMSNSADEGSEVSDVEEELQDYEMHTPDWSGTTESDWSSPDMEDFDTDDLSEIANHFLISSSGFPPENFSDLKLPVVEPSGDLNVNALSAVKGGRGVSAVDGLSDDMEMEIVEWVNNTANEEFDKDWAMEENADAEQHDDKTAGRPTPGENTVGGVRVLSGDDLQQGNKSGESDLDSLTNYKVTNMTENIEEKLSELDEPVAVEAAEVDELRNKADRFEEMSESLEALRERTDILDEVDRSQVEELADSEDAVVVESDRYEELTSEAEEVKGVYAAQLAEQYDAFDAEELTDKFSIEELREKYEENFGSVEDLASSDDAEPRSQDADEESLEDAADESDDESDSDEAELAEQAAEKQAEMKQKILEGR